MEFECADLGRSDDAGHGIDIEVVGLAAILLADGHGLEAIRHPGRQMLLVEALVADAIGAAHQAQRMTGGKGQHVSRDHLQVFRQFAFGEA